MSELVWPTTEQVAELEGLSRVEVYRRMEPRDSHALVWKNREDGRPGRLINPHSMSIDAQRRWRHELLEAAAVPKAEPAQPGLLPRTRRGRPN
jgi:hypothetical protein